MKGTLFLLATVFCLHSVILSNAQIRTAKVVLKNGNKLMGEVVELVPDDHLTLRILEGEEVRIPYDQVYKFKNNTFSYQSFSKLDDGYFNYSSIGFTFLNTGSYEGLDGLDWNIHTLNGYRFHSNYNLGIGVGIDRYLLSSALPIYLGGRADLSKTHVTPTVFSNLGYGFMWVKKSNLEFENISAINGGLYWEAGMGITFRNLHSNFSFNLAYKHQSSEITYEDQWWWELSDRVTVEKHKYRNITFTFGMTF